MSRRSELAVEQDYQLVTDTYASHTAIGERPRGLLEPEPTMSRSLVAIAITSLSWPVFGACRVAADHVPGPHCVRWTGGYAKIIVL